MKNAIDPTSVDINKTYSSLLDGNAKKIKCSHEIVFNISASVMQEDKDGKDIGCEELMIKYYHIPVKEGEDYKQFLNAFFGFLEKCLASSAKNAYETTSSIPKDQKS